MYLKSNTLCFLMTALVVTAICPVIGQAQQRPPATVTKPLPPDTQIGAELNKIFERLGNELKEADAIATRLRSAAQKTPEDAKAQVDDATKLLSGLADRLKPTGDVAGQVEALRNAATANRKRVADMPATMLDEMDRQRILDKWDSISRNAAGVTSAMADMRSKVVSSVENLRLRQVAIAELVLAGEFEGAINSLKKWLADLDQTMKDLHAAVEGARPTS
jgi:hypothetical protein